MSMAHLIIYVKTLHIMPLRLVLIVDEKGNLLYTRVI